MVNNAMLKMLCRAFPDEVVCYASKSAMPHLETSGCVKKKKIYVNAGNGKLAVLLRYIVSTVHNVMILLASGKSDLLFYNYNNVFSLWLIDFVNRFKKTKVVICCHGELEFVSLDTDGFPLYKRVMSALVRHYFNKGNLSPARGVNFIVLSDIALENLQPYVSKELIGRFDAIDHPVMPVESFRSLCPGGNDGERCVNIGTVGILNEHKGSGQYLRLIRRVNKERKDIRFHAIGHIQCDPSPFIESGVSLPAKVDEPLPYESFLREVDTLDFILYFYSSDKYRLTASGALLDAIRFRKPVIALRNDYFEYFFNKFGELGYLVDSVEEMAELIIRSENLNKEFKFDEIEKKLSVERLQDRFDEIIKPLAQ